MPKLKTTSFEHRNKAGEHRTFKSDLSVTNNGIFSATVPEDVAHMANTVLSKHRELADIGVKENSVNWRLTGKNLDLVTRAVELTLKELMAVQTTTRRILVYSYKTDLSAWEDPDGALHANGQYGHNDGRWHPMGEHLSANRQSAYYQVGIYAEILDEHVHQRSQSTATEYTRPFWTGEERDSFGARLNAFPTLKGPSDPGKLPCMPYTEENARFFYEMLISMCELGRRMHSFFGDEGNIRRAIENGAPALLSASQ